MPGGVRQPVACRTADGRAGSPRPGQHTPAPSSSCLPAQRGSGGQRAHPAVCGPRHLSHQPHPHPVAPARSPRGRGAPAPRAGGSPVARRGESTDGPVAAAAGRPADMGSSGRARLHWCQWQGGWDAPGRVPGHLRLARHLPRYGLPFLGCAPQAEVLAKHGPQLSEGALEEMRYTEGVVRTALCQVLSCCARVRLCATRRPGLRTSCAGCPAAACLAA